MLFRFNAKARFLIIRYWASRINGWHILHALFGIVCRFIGKFIPAPIKTKWGNLSHDQQLIFKNIAIGLFISLALHLTHATSWLQVQVRGALDWTINMNAGTRFGANVGKEGKEKLYAFINIDENQYVAWEEPLFTPRDKIVDLIRNSVSGGARLIVVDIDLTRPSPEPGQDFVLRDYLASLKHIPLKERPPIILVKSMQMVKRNNDEFPRFRNSFLDEIVSVTPGLYWASPMFTVDEDQVIRYWRIVECASSDEGDQVLPSIQLLVYALLTPGIRPGENLYASLQDMLNKSSLECKSIRALGSETKNRFSFENLTFSLNDRDIENRIIYSIKPGIPSPIVESSGNDRPIFLSIPSQTLLINKNNLNDLKDILKDRIVILGGSFADSYDNHETPIGVMPGAMIIINSIRSLFVYGIVHEPSWWLTAIIEVTLILIMSVSFMIFRSFWGMVVSGAFVIIFLIPASLVFFRFGVWLDFAIPLVAVQLHQMADEFDHKSIKYS